MTGIRVAAVVLGALTSGAGFAQSCGVTLAGAPRTVENAHYTVAYVTTPDPVAVGSHFVVDFAVCPRRGARAPQSIRVDASMPEHKHGMNYRPGVTQPRAGTYRAEGLLFHMPGRWELTFDIVTGDATQRLATSMNIE